MRGQKIIATGTNHSRRVLLLSNNASRGLNCSYHSGTTNIHGKTHTSECFRIHSFLLAQLMVHTKSPAYLPANTLLLRGTKSWVNKRSTCFWQAANKRI